MTSLMEEQRGLTWDEYLALPYETRNAALIDGEVVVDAPNAQHEFVVFRLHVQLEQWASAGRDRGEVSTQQPVKVNDRRGYQPDILWFPQRYCAPPGEARSFSGPPSLVAEVLSPSTRRFDLIRKRGDYEHLGIAEVWFVDPEPGQYGILACQRLEPDAPFVDAEVKSGDVLTSPLLDGFELHVARVFGS
jgi:Uma2 family endonuclease